MGGGTVNTHTGPSHGALHMGPFTWGPPHHIYIQGALPDATHNKYIRQKKEKQHYISVGTVGLGESTDSSMHRNSFVLDSVSIQNSFEIDYFHKK